MKLSLVRWNPVLLNKKEYCLFCRNIDSMLGGDVLVQKCFLTKQVCCHNNEGQSNGEYFVFLGYQFCSKYYRQVDLLSCIQIAVELANQDLVQIHRKLKLRRVGLVEGIHMSCEICGKIKTSEICIFEISDRNPNVLFELGMATGKEIVLLKSMQSGDVPSDISGIKYTHYNNEDDFEKLQIVLAKILYDTTASMPISISNKEEVNE